jgi:hypothetical protein
MADLPDVLPWNIRPIGRKMRAYFDHVRYFVHDLCMKLGFSA